MSRVVWAAVVTFVAGVVISRFTAHHGWLVVAGSGLALSALFVATVWWSGPQRRKTRKRRPELPRRVFRATTPG